jgi:hypothetical protein
VSLSRRPGPAKLTEDEDAWLSWVVDYATRVARPPWRIYHTRYSKGSHAGFPDLVMVRPPRLIFAELKTDTGRLTRAQTEWRDDIQAVADWPEGGAVEWHEWRPADRPEIERILR